MKFPYCLPARLNEEMLRHKALVSIVASYIRQVDLEKYLEKVELRTKISNNDADSDYIRCNNDNDTQDNEIAGFYHINNNKSIKYRCKFV